MKKKIIVWILIVLAVLIALGTAFCLLFPRPKTAENLGDLQWFTDEYTEGSGAFTLGEKTRFFLLTDSPEEETLALCRLISVQFAASGLPSETAMPVVWGTERQIRRQDIVLSVDDTELRQDGYRIEVNAKNLRIVGANRRGLLYGAFTVIKQLRANGSNTIAGCTLTEEPDAAERTVMIDCGRKYYTAEWLKNFIRQAAYQGYNTIELHFSDDQGTRFDIWDPEYFTDNRNGNDFSWICGGYVGSWVKEEFHDYADVKKYLTAQEVDEILRTAAAYQMDVIPAMDSPGHCQYLCRQYEKHATTSLKFNYDGTNYAFYGIQKEGEERIPYTELVKQYPNTKFSTIFTGNHITLDVTNPYGRAFLLAIIEDYARFFRQYGCDTFHIGADEVRLHTNGYGSVEWSNYVAEGYSKYDTFVDYINEESAMLKDLGYTVRAFSDFFDYVSDDPDYDQHIALDPDIEMSYWIADYDLETAPNVHSYVGKRPIYNCLQNYCYYALTESWLGKDGRDPTTRDWDFYYSTADRIYEYWNPTVFEWPEDPGLGTVLAPEQVSGGYFLIWCDNAAQNTQDEIWHGLDENGKFNVIERMWANSAKMWTYDLNDRLDFERFQSLTQSFGFFPGYTDCSEPPVLPEPPQAFSAD